MGVIDFGDAYVSHPAFDLRRWNGPAEREALLAGYTAEQPVGDAFLAVRRAVLILADLAALLGAGQDPERVAVVRDDLAALFAEL